MSCVYKGEVINSEQSANAKGGTEMMRQRFVDLVDKDLQDSELIELPY